MTPLTPEEKKRILDQARAIRTTEDLEAIKDVICTFYRSGDNPLCDHPEGCDGCTEPHKIIHCRDEYCKRIFTRPQLYWTPEFDKPKVRAKIMVEEEVGLHCDRCYMSESCPHFEAMATCAIDWGTYTPEELTPTFIVDYLLKMQVQRVNRQSKFEQMDGGVADQNLSVEMDRLAELASKKDYLHSDRAKVTITAESKGQGGGLLASLFGGGLPAADKAKELPAPKTIDITPEFKAEKISDEYRPKGEKKREE